MQCGPACIASSIGPVLTNSTNCLIFASPMTYKLLKILYIIPASCLFLYTFNKRTSKIYWDFVFNHNNYCFNLFN